MVATITPEQAPATEKKHDAAVHIDRGTTLEHPHKHEHAAAHAHAAVAHAHPAVAHAHTAVTHAAPSAAIPAITPEMLAAAEKKLDATIDAALGRNVTVKINRGGVSIGNSRPDASEEALEFVVKDEKFKTMSAKDIEEEGKKLLAKLNEDRALRRGGIMVSPHEYLNNCAKEVKFFQDEAKAAGISTGELDLSKASILNPDFSGNQKPKHGTQVIDGPNNTFIRINIPMNPQKLEEAEAEAKKVAAAVEANKDASLKGLIDYIERKEALDKLSPEQQVQYKKNPAELKAYLDKPENKLTPERRAHLEKHEVKVTTQQQQNCTSVFVTFSSPEQVVEHEHPERKTPPEQLAKTNIFSEIPDADRRSKAAARTVLFTGKDLNHPASYFVEVAGTDDIKNYLGKLLKHTVAKKPELLDRAKDLMEENFLISNEDGMLPPEQQTTRKQPVSASLKPGTDELKIRFHTKIGRGDEILAHLAGGAAPAVTPSAPAAPADGKHTNAVNEAMAIMDKEAAAAAAAACAPGEIAVAGAGAAANERGEVAATAAAGCVEKPPEKPKVQLGSVLPKGVTPEALKSFLADHKQGISRN